MHKIRCKKTRTNHTTADIHKKYCAPNRNKTESSEKQTNHCRHRTYRDKNNRGTVTMHKQANARANTKSLIHNTHTSKRVQKHNKKCSHSQHTHADTHIHTYTHTHIHTYTHTHTSLHTCTPRGTHKFTHTYSTRMPRPEQ